MELVKCIDLCKSFDNVKILKNINITIERGKIYGLLGKNGTGKRFPARLKQKLFHHGSPRPAPKGMAPRSSMTGSIEQKNTQSSRPTVSKKNSLIASITAQHLLVVFLFCHCLPLTAKQGRQRFIDQKRDQRVQKTLKASKRDVEHQETHQKSVHARPNCLIHTDNGLDRHKLGVNRISNEIVDGQTDQSHHHRSQNRGKQRRPARVAEAIDKTRGQYQSNAKQTVAQFPNAPRCRHG